MRALLALTVVALAGCGGGFGEPTKEDPLDEETTAIFSFDREAALAATDRLAWLSRQLALK